MIKKGNEDYEVSFFIQINDMFSVGERIIGILKLLLGEYNDIIPLEANGNI